MVFLSFGRWQMLVMDEEEEAEKNKIKKQCKDSQSMDV